jgi:hypothetical protein
MRFGAVFAISQSILNPYHSNKLALVGIARVVIQRKLNVKNSMKSPLHGTQDLSNVCSKLKP